LTSRRTPLYAEHLALGARMVDFAGWEMPIQYAGVIAEHQAVRSKAGLFDLSHMAQIHVRGAGAAAALDAAVVSQPSSLAPGRAQYSIIVDSAGMMIDDLVIYRRAEDAFLVVSNASNGEHVARELGTRIGSAAAVSDQSPDAALIAVQGPAAVAILTPYVQLADAKPLDSLAGYASSEAHLRIDERQVACMIARTGYTGEDGFEIYLAGVDASATWRALLTVGASAGLQPIGLGARDTLRLEAGMPLFGNDLRSDLTPYDVGFGRVVRLDKPGDFVGATALRARSSASPDVGRQLVALRVTGRGIARQGYAVLSESGESVGTVTSGTHSPSLGQPIALADVAAAAGPWSVGRSVAVRVREESVAAEVVALPFVPKRSKRRG
jgi:aminomethyltransferase